MYIYIFHNFSPFIPLKLADFFPPKSSPLWSQELVHRHEQEAVSDVSGKRSSVELVPWVMGSFFFFVGYIYINI
jgi:hypothetical protein